MGRKNKDEIENEQELTDSNESVSLQEEIILPKRVRLHREFVFCKEHPHGATQLIHLHAGQVVDDPELIAMLHEHGALME